MAFRVVSSFYALTDGALIHKLKEELVAEGWDVVMSGSGTGAAYNATGDVHAPGTAYAGTLDLANAWFRLRAPATMSPRREFVFQRPNTTHSIWRIYYSSNGTGFTGATPSATVRPTATDEQAFINTNASTTVWWATVTGATKIDIIIGDLSEGFSFFFGVREIGEFIYRGGFGLDVLQNANGADTDQAVLLRLFAASSSKQSTNEFFRGNNTAFFTNTAFAAASGMGGAGWYKKGLTGAAFVSYIPNLMGVQTGAGSYVDLGDRLLGQSSDGTFPRWPNVVYSRGPNFTTEKGWKGRSRLLKYEILSAAGIRLNSDSSRLIAGCFSLPWDGSSSITH